MRKKLFAILMSAMMMVTFMPAMAFATATVPTGDVVSIEWNDTCTSAKVGIAVSDTVTQYVTVESVAQSDNVIKDVKLTAIEGRTLKNGLTTADLTKTVCDFANVKVYDHKGELVGTTTTPKKVDADTYSAWLENKDATTLPADVKTSYAVTKVTYANGTTALKSTDYTVDYAKYAAYEYAAAPTTGAIVNKTDKLVVEATDAFKNAILHENPAIKFMNTKKEIVYEFDLSDKDVNGYYFGWKMMNGTTAFVDGQPYDGNTYTATMNHPAQNTTVLYNVKYNKTSGSAFTAPKDDEWTATPATMKDAGYYQVSVKMTVDAYGTDWSKAESVTFHVAQKDVYAVAKQTKFVKDYDGIGFVVDDSCFDIHGLVAGDTLIVNPKATSANVGDYNITAGYAQADINSNYNLVNNFWLKSTGTINKNENTSVSIKTSSKTYKAKTLKKGKKSFTVKVSSNVGATPKLKKVSGSSKLSVKSGKIVVKKGTKKGTYKIKVKAYVNGTSNFVKASATKTIKVKVK